MGLLDLRFSKAGNLIHHTFITSLLCLAGCINTTSALAGSILENPLFDAKVHLDGGSFALVEGETSLSVQYVDFANIDRRAILEYDISSIPDIAKISLAQITFDLSSFSGGPGDVVEAPIYGYGGDGLAAVADGLEISTQIGTLGPIDSLDPITIDLDLSFVESLLATSNYLGINILGDPDSNSVSFATLELNDIISTIPPAQLSLTYNIPGDFDNDDDVDELDYNTWQSSFANDDGADADGDNDSDGIDFLTWQQNFAQSSPAIAAAVIPEPGTATLLLLAATLLTSVTCRNRTF